MSDRSDGTAGVAPGESTRALRRARVVLEGKALEHAPACSTTVWAVPGGGGQSVPTVSSSLELGQGEDMSEEAVSR
jgi:hypothetical protein